MRLFSRVILFHLLICLSGAHEPVDYDILRAGYEEVRDNNSETMWAVFKYGDDGKTINVGSTGTEYDAMIANFGANERAYAYVRFLADDNTDKSDRDKYAFITWIGPSLSPRKKGKVSTDKAFVKNIVSQYATEILANDLREVQKEKVKTIVMRAG